MPVSGRLHGALARCIRPVYSSTHVQDVAQQEGCMTKGMGRSTHSLPRYSWKTHSRGSTAAASSKAAAARRQRAVNSSAPSGD